MPPGALEPGGGAPGIDQLAPSDRDRILEAMIECCAEKGYAETTIEEVVQRADVSISDFDAIFTGKEDCAVAALNRIASDILTTLSTSGSSEPSELKGELSAMHSMIELMAARPSHVNFGYIQARQGGTARMHDAYESGARVLTVMIERLRNLAPAGAATPTTATRAALGGAEAVLRRELSAGQAERLPSLLPDFAYNVLVPFVGQEEALRQSRLVAEQLNDAI